MNVLFKFSTMMPALRSPIWLQPTAYSLQPRAFATANRFFPRFT
jgi:hypothetical protein